MSRQSLAKLETKHLMCRSWAHAWDYVVSYVEREGRMSVIEVHLHCTRCRGDKIYRYNHVTGRVLGPPRYKYPEGYVVDDLNSWGGRKRLNANVRAELFTRFAKGTKLQKGKEKSVA